MHRQLVRALIAEIRQLREQLNAASESECYASEVEARANRRVRAELDAAEDARRNAEYRASEYESVSRDLAKAAERGDDYGVSKAKSRLRWL